MIRILLGPKRDPSVKLGTSLLNMKRYLAAGLNLSIWVTLISPSQLSQCFLCRKPLTPCFRSGAWIPNGIMYNSRRFQALEQGSFWLSATPDVPHSATWAWLQRSAFWSVRNSLLCVSLLGLSNSPLLRDSVIFPLRIAR
jgi:hypothetical protein